MVSVDGDTSTNDTVLVMANGMAGNPEITEENEDYEAFKEHCSQSILILQSRSPVTERGKPSVRGAGETREG